MAQHCRNWESKSEEEWGSTCGRGRLVALEVRAISLSPAVVWCCVRLSNVSLKYVSWEFNKYCLENWWRLDGVRGFSLLVCPFWLVLKCFCGAGINEPSPYPSGKCLCEKLPFFFFNFPSMLYKSHFWFTEINLCPANVGLSYRLCYREISKVHVCHSDLVGSIMFFYSMQVILYSGLCEQFMDWGFLYAWVKMYMSAEDLFIPFSISEWHCWCSYVA